MAEFPGDIYIPRETENLPGIVYDADNKRNMFSEDFQNLGAEINAIETILGINPQGDYDTVGERIEAGGGGGGGGGGDYLSDLLNSEISITATGATFTLNRQHVISGTSSNYTITLPPVSGNAGKFVGIRISVSATKLFTIDGDSSDLIDGALSRIMWAGESAILYCDGSSWSKISGKSIPMTAILKQASSQTGLTAGAYNAITLGVVELDNAGLMTGTANTITILRPGRYQIGEFTIVTGSPLGFIDPFIYKNGSSLQQVLFGVAAQGYAGGCGVWQFDLAVNDAIRMYIFLDGFAASGATYYSSPDQITKLSVLEIPSW